MENESSAPEFFSVGPEETQTWKLKMDEDETAI